jgi:hypothetical protein
LPGWRVSAVRHGPHGGHRWQVTNLRHDDGIGGKAPTFGTTAGVCGSVTFGMTVSTAAGIRGSAAVFDTTWICGTMPTAGTVGMANNSGRVATGTIDSFGTTGMPGTVTRATGGRA